MQHDVVSWGLKRSDVVWWSKQSLPITLTNTHACTHRKEGCHGKINTIQNQRNTNQCTNIVDRSNDWGFQTCCGLFFVLFALQITVWFGLNAQINPASSCYYWKKSDKASAHLLSTKRHTHTHTQQVQHLAAKGVGGGQNRAARRVSTELKLIRTQRLCLHCKS